jgi:glycosyltransferase involved in cell wall biosynthesis
MNLLFLHQNFPAQFKHLAPALAQRGHDVKALTLRPEAPAAWQGVDIVRYTPQRGNAPGIHPWVLDFESKVIRGEAVFRAALEMKRAGYRPDAIVAHPGWGESLFVKEVWPSARLGLYCEFYYRAQGADVGFDPEFSAPDPSTGCRMLVKNANLLMQFDAADGALSPTRWQANGFPEPFRRRIQVVHDGIDTRMVAPRPTVRITLPDRAGLALSRQDEVITFVNRNLEPGRGYHVLMRALPALLRRRPGAHVLIVGGDGSSYGPAPADGSTWKARFANEARAQMDATEWARVHFLGNVPHAQFVGMLQLSSVHVYLTYPFVLGWSLIEAMSAGCAIVASDTAPVQEVIQHGETGRLVSFFDQPALIEQICDLLDSPQERVRLGANARAEAMRTFDLMTVCLPRQIQWVESLADPKGEACPAADL